MSYFGESISDGETYGNILNNSSTTVTADNAASAAPVSRVYSDLLGEAAELRTSVTIYSSGSRQNNKIYVNVGSGAETATLTAGQYTISAFLSHMDSVMDADLSVTGWDSANGGYDTATNILTIRNTSNAFTMLWNTGSGAGTDDVATTLGADTTSDQVAVLVSGDYEAAMANALPINADQTYTGTGAIPGHWIKVSAKAAFAPNMFAIYKPRWSRDTAGTSTPSELPTTMDVRVWGHTSDLGSKIGDWQDTATEVFNLRLYKASTQATTGSRYELRCYIETGNASSFQYWLIQFEDQDGSEDGYPALRLPYVFLGIATEFSANFNAAIEADLGVVLPGGGGTAQDPVWYSASGPAYRMETYHYMATLAEMEVLEKMVLRLRRKPALCIADDSLVTDPSGGETVDHRAVLYASPFMSNKLDRRRVNNSPAAYWWRFSLTLREHTTG